MRIGLLWCVLARCVLSRFVSFVCPICCFSVCVCVLALVVSESDLMAGSASCQIGGLNKFTWLMLLDEVLF